MTQKSVNKEKFNIIMFCVHAQMFTNNQKLLQNSPSWRTFKIRSADQGSISLPVHYFFVYSKTVSNQIIASRFEIKIIHLLNECSVYLFIDLNLVTRAEAVTSVSA